MENVRLTEKDVIDKLVNKAKFVGEVAPRAIVISRRVDTNRPHLSLTRTVRIALVVTSNNETLIDALIQECVNNDNDFYFVGSEVNLQDGSMEVDYLFFETKILAKK